MRAIVVIGILFVGLVVGDTVLYPRGCIYIFGKCLKECPVGTHAYAPSCGFMTPEATCGDRTPREGTAIVCDYSACYCDPPTVRDERTDSCVPVHQCPQEGGEVSVPVTFLPPLVVAKENTKEADVTA